jgi:hypothetical protein
MNGFGNGLNHTILEANLYLFIEADVINALNGLAVCCVEHRKAPVEPSLG